VRAVFTIWSVQPPIPSHQGSRDAGLSRAGIGCGFRQESWAVRTDWGALEGTRRYSGPADSWCSVSVEYAVSVPLLCLRPTIPTSGRTARPGGI